MHTYPYYSLSTMVFHLVSADMFNHTVSRSVNYITLYNFSKVVIIFTTVVAVKQSYNVEMDIKT